MGRCDEAAAPAQVNVRVAGWALFAGYAGYNLLRKTWPAAIAQPVFSAELVATSAAIGTASSMHSAVYGLSKFFSCVLCDLLPVSREGLFCFGLVFCGVVSIAMSFCQSIFVLTVLWSIQAAGQGLAWPAATQILIARMGQNNPEMGFYWGLISISGNIGQVWKKVTDGLAFK